MTQILFTDIIPPGITEYLEFLGSKEVKWRKSISEGFYRQKSFVSLKT